MEPRIVIIGAGPTGLGAAYQLNKLGYTNWAVYEKNDYIGGLSASFKDNRGFTWDIGGHILFSRYSFFDNLLNRLLGNQCSEYERKTYIWMMNSWIPYPFQNNIRFLPKKVALECVMGLIEAQKTERSPSNYKEWLLNVFGTGIAKCFMLDHNSKLWSYPLEMMDKNWISERVSVVNVKQVLENMLCERDDVDWGPNTRFKYPLSGGIGSFFNRFMPYIKERLYLNKELVEIELQNKRINFQDGSDADYDILINTSPLDKFISSVKGKYPELGESIKCLEKNGMLMVGIGLEDFCPADKHWIYFPENNCPFNRVTYLSNYSSNNVPDHTKFCSLMTETTYSRYKTVSKENIINDIIKGLINAKAVSKSDEGKIVGTYVIDAEYAYPIPTLKRDEALRFIQTFLQNNDVYSRGRFGAWKYEIGNMDHSVMQGVECVERLLLGKEESVWTL